MMPNNRGSNVNTTTLTDELVVALQDSKVVEALGKALAPLIALSINEALGKRLEGLEKTVRQLNEEKVCLHKRIDQAMTENQVLRDEKNELAKWLYDMEAYSRTENLIVKGLPESTAAERATAGASLDQGVTESHGAVEETFIKFARKTLNVEVKPSYISIAHRLKSGPKDTVRPIIVRFTNRKIRNNVYYSKRQLKDSGMYINEHLTKETSDLHFEARKLVKNKKLYSAWTNNGQLFVRVSSDPSSRPQVVRTKADLARF